ncbi:MAG: HNH endonuclease [Nitrospiraceae bacterium]
MAEMSDVAIQWLRPRISKGEIDLFPRAAFARTGVLPNFTHRYIESSGEQYLAKCRLEVRERHAELDYGAHPRFNEVRSNELGVLRLHFVDSRRTRLSHFEWRPRRSKSFTSGWGTVTPVLLDNAAFERQVRKSLKSSPEQRRKRLLSAPRKPRKMEVVTTVFVRNPDVVAEVLARAKGKCAQCGRPAPFTRASDGSPYLEIHHRVRLVDGGDDTVSNALALCPNCHRQRHFG